MLKILIVDDHAVVRDGIKRIFEEPGGRVAFGEASCAAEGLALARRKDWDVVVLDLSLGGRNGIELLKEMRRARPRLPVIILSMYSEEQYARRAFKAGAAGYVTKDSPSDELVKAVRSVAGGGRYVSPSLAERLVIDFENASDRPPHEALSDREFEVMLLIASGRMVGEIAVLLSLSAKTVSTYRARVLQKMGMKTNADLTRYAIHNNLVN
jgi:DNA-binding NarL/FixJ family response regulator